MCPLKGNLYSWNKLPLNEWKCCVNWRLIKILRFSITCKMWSPRRIMQNCFTLPSIMSWTSQETSTIFQRGQQVTLLVRDWRIAIHFTCFYFWMTVTIMIDGSVKSNRKFGFKLQSSHVIEKRYKVETSTKLCEKLETNTSHFDVWISR